MPRTTPVGVPVAGSRSSSPGNDPADAPSRPQAVRAALFSTAASYSACRYTGWAGATASSSALEGRRRSASWEWCQPPRTRTQEPGGCPAARSWMARSTSSRRWQCPRRSSSSQVSPARIAWMWASTRPGTARRPSRSTTTARGPARASSWWLWPVASTRPSRTARASTSRAAGAPGWTPVQIRPLSSRRSAEPGGLACIWFTFLTPVRFPHSSVRSLATDCSAVKARPPARADAGLGRLGSHPRCWRGSRPLPARRRVPAPVIRELSAGYGWRSAPQARIRADPEPRQLLTGWLPAVPSPGRRRRTLYACLEMPASNPQTRGDRLGSGGELPEGWAGARDALAGAVAAAVALGSTELVAGLLRGTPSLVQSVAAVVIDSAPIGLVRAAIAALGTRDKPVLVAGVVVLSLAFGAGLALASRRRRWVAVAGLAAFAAVGGWGGSPPPGVEPGRPVLGGPPRAV